MGLSPARNDLQTGTFFAVQRSFLQQRGVKTSLPLVNEFTGADVSLDQAAGGVGGRGGGVVGGGGL